MNKKPICAILYDFDSTLATTDMQNFGFIPALGLTPAEFWGETTRFSNETGCEKILSYLYTMIAMARQKGIKLDKAFLRECGKNIKFFPGVTTWFDRINQYGAEHGVKVEHYLISSGNKEIVEGCPIANQFKVMYGCEYVFDKNTGEILETARRRRVVKEIVPDVRALLFWLKNRRPHRWCDRREEPAETPGFEFDSSDEAL